MRLATLLAATLQAGGTVVASNPRLARTLRRLHGEAERERGLAAWQAAEIVDWDGWLERWWRRQLRAGNEMRLLLSRAQERQVWVRLVKPSIEGRRLISLDGVADLAQGAYALLGTYDAFDFLRGEVFAGPDIESFRGWARNFERECLQFGWISRSNLPLVLREKLSQADGALPPQLMLAGFDRVTPAQRSLLTAYEAAGCRVGYVEAPNQLIPIEALVETDSPRDEIALCAQWTLHNLQLASSEGRRIRIAVMAPDVNSVRSEIERSFRQTLAPESVSVSAPESPLPFEFSLGAPLAQSPMVRAALLLLRWMTEGLRLEELSWLTLSGFLWREESDLLSLAEFDAETRQERVLPLEQELDAYLRRNGWNRSEARKGLRDRLWAARRAWREGRRERLGFAQWTERAEEILSAAGWPGAHQMTSEDFQVRAKWGQLLDGIATLSFEDRLVGYEEFLATLEREAKETIFSPESHEAPVQILGPFEAAGLEFDAIWFLGADDQSWPSPAQMHPFLLPVLQKQRGMPHADDHADWELTRLVTERIQKSAPQSIFSYSAQDKDGPRRPSTVLEPRPPILSAAQMRELLGVSEAGQPDFPALSIAEEPASGILWPGERSAGGYAVLKMQAACPFQAFAHFRLGARELDRTDWGLDPMERGKLLHKVLEELWSDLKDRDSLIRARDDGRLRSIVEEHVDRAAARYGSSRTGRDAAPEEENWSSAYLRAERERVVQLVEEWLAYEERRLPFTVERRETSFMARVGALELKLRADRIDQVEGGRLLIDYKTARVASSAWEGERPDEPQLPLYAAYGDVADLRGVLLAQIRAGDLKLEGSVDHPSLVPGNPKTPPTPYTEDLRRQWEKVLLALGEQFARGEAQVDPKRYPKTCEFCALPALCRVAENRREWMDAEQEGSGEEQNGNGEE